MVEDRADAMLEVMDEDMHEGKYRRIEVITGLSTAEPAERLWLELSVLVHDRS